MWDTTPYTNGPHTVKMTVYDAKGQSGSMQVNVTVNNPVFAAKINFQPAAAPAYVGYAVDGGAVYGARGNGLTYGWNVDVSGGARDRNSALSPDQRYDTLLGQINGLTWELALPNGAYTVHVVEGDPDWADVRASLSIEGVLALSGNTSSAMRWIEGTVPVTVNDGRLTLTFGATDYDKICFLEVSSAGTPKKPPERDFNGDRRADLLLRHPSSGDVLLWLMP